MIFISIASYRDEDLVNTIQSIYENADRPDEIRVVVLNQNNERQDTEYPNVEMFYIDPLKSRGVSWARALIQNLMEDEKYYLQIDAHMRFAKGWDTKMIHYLTKANSQKPVLTYYPPAFDDDWYGQMLVKNVIRGVGSGAVSSINEILDPAKVTLQNGLGMPIRSHTAAAGFLFAPSSFPKEIPIDPKIYWNYEETDVTLRAYTNGWDFFAAPEPLIWHRYNTTGKMKHTEDSNDWVGRENFSNEHAPKKYFDPTYDYPATYKLGSARSIESFQILNNVDLQARSMDPKADKKMLVVVPYRDREEHLREYLARVPQYLKDLDCDILICELEDGCDWNAGLSVNSAINFMDKANYEFIYVSHVDVYPYQGWEWPEPGTFISDMGDVGSCLVRMEDFLKVGGYGNNFWGWGGEDDNLYHKLMSIGLTRIKSRVLFDTKYQNHDRPFNGINYTNNLREIHKPIDFTPIFNVNKISRTRELSKLYDNVYKQIVEVTAERNMHRKVLVGYLKDVKIFDLVAPWLKSAIYCGTDYDVWLITNNDDLTKEIKAFGGHVFNWTPETDNLFIDRMIAYKEFLRLYPYDEVIHIDVTDAYIQNNPFSLMKDDLFVTTEGMAIEYCYWNLNMIKRIYGDFDFSKNEIICGGMFGGKRERFLELCDMIIQESNNYPVVNDLSGSDQPILNKMVYSGALAAAVYKQESGMVAHLHHYFNNADVDVLVNGIIVTNKSGEQYAVVHQYNRQIELYNNVLNFYRDFFSVNQVG